MDLILSNLSTLKTHLLTAALLSGTDYDAPIAALGKGVAELFQKRCNRLFPRVALGTFDFSADRTHVVLPRYPVEAITVVELRETLADGWVDQGAVNDFILNLSEKAGLVRFNGIVGGCNARVRLTYTGGYHVNTLEPDAIGYPTALPAGATALPNDLLFAWLFQCEYIWNSRDKLGLSIAEKPAAWAAGIAAIDLLPLVERTLRDYTRHTLT
jgi:hypothetical protein